MQRKTIRKNQLEMKVEEQEETLKRQDEIIRIQAEKLRETKFFNKMMMEYRFAIMEIETRLKALNGEFSQEYNRDRVLQPVLNDGTDKRFAYKIRNPQFETFVFHFHGVFPAYDQYGDFVHPPFLDGRNILLCQCTIRKMVGDRICSGYWWWMMRR